MRGDTKDTFIEPEPMNQNEQDNSKYLFVVKSGRCFNGASRDSGSVIHIITGIDENDLPSWQKALCGSEPATKLGNGWTNVYQAPTCQVCIDRHEALRPKNNEPFFI